MAQDADGSKPPPPRKGPQLGNRQTFSAGYFLIALAVLFGLQSLISVKANELSYSDFKKKLAEGQVQEVTISDTLVRGTLKPAKPDEKPASFITVPVEDKELVPELEKQGVAFRGQYESPLLNALLTYLLPGLVFVGIWMLA